MKLWWSILVTLILSGSSFNLKLRLNFLLELFHRLQYSFIDKIITFSVILGISISSFFRDDDDFTLTVELKLLPASGMYSCVCDLIDLL